MKQENVCYVVAPYEADAQMTFLAISKQVDAVITEDSDLIPFGCPRVSCVAIEYSQLHTTVSLMFTRKRCLILCFSSFIFLTLIKCYVPLSKAGYL